MTLQLPESLTPWRRELSLFPVDLAIDLGSLVRRLAAAIGAPVATRHRGDDPDGYDGIVHTGPYDRMLHSEWLLASEVPDEFLRRAVMREQLFFRVARRSPLDDLVSVALFDAGPTQLGNPRLLHVALLIVLSQRAAERGGSFRWSVLQQPPPRTFRDRLDEDAVHDLLRARSGSEAGEEDLQAFDELLPDGDPRHREAWLIGGRQLARTLERLARSSPAARVFRGASLLVIEEPLEPGPRELRVEIRKADAAPRQLTLDLPAERAAVRLLRDPFDRAVVGAPASGGRVEAAHLMFAGSGKRVISRASDGGIIVDLLGGTSKEYGALRKQPVVAAGWGRTKGGASISVTDDRMLVLGPLHRQRNTVALLPAGDFPFEAELADLATLRPVIAVSQQSRRPHDYLFLDATGGCWLTDAAARSAMRVTTGVRAIANHAGDPYLACIKGGWVIEKIEGDRPVVIGRYPGSGTQAFFGTATGDSRVSGLLIALETEADRWAVITEQAVTHSYATPPGARAIGVTAMRNAPHASVVFAERYAITLAIGLSMLTPVKTDEPIEAAACDPSGPRVAYVSGGVLFVFDLHQMRVVYRRGSAQ